MLNNVCVFGDSIAKGVVYDPEKKKYVFLGESFVNLLSHEKQIEILNFSSCHLIERGVKDRIAVNGIFFLCEVACVKIDVFHFLISFQLEFSQ